MKNSHQKLILIAFLICSITTVAEENDPTNQIKEVNALKTQVQFLLSRVEQLEQQQKKLLVKIAEEPGEVNDILEPQDGLQRRSIVIPFAPA